MNTFEGKVALVSGAASGIGAAIVRQLAAGGAKVVLADIAVDGAQALADELDPSGLDLRVVQVNVADAASVEAMVAFAVATFGALHLAVNNAGIPGSSRPTADYSLEAWHKVIDVNLNGVFYAMKYEIAAMLASGGGAIVNMSSAMGSNGLEGSVAYVASKHAVVGMTKTAALEYSARGIRVNAVAPGFIDTPLLKKADAAKRAELIAKHPIGRLGTPDEVASLTTFLLSDKASFVTGSYHLVDGAYSAQ
jgi:NAD(P)-dependent dehydrogenase (short-subunit alcohol dehydrogenase family)